MILYLYPVQTAFTDRDIAMLRKRHRVKAIEFTQSPVKLPWYFIKQFFQLLFHLPETSHYLCFFGGYHSVLPTLFGKLFSKKVFIQCGGTDAMNLPAIGYGNYRKKWLKKATIYSFRNCSLILPVAKALVQSEYHYDPSIPVKQGLLNLITALKTPIQVIPNGFDTGFWKNLELPRTEFSFISIATGISITNRAMVKGVDLIEQLAVRFPDYHFTLVGDEHYQSPSSNIRVYGKKDREELRKLFNEHQFYLQLSMSEGFPNALAEAMLCGCVPIGSAVGAIPEIIQDHGLILKQKNFPELESLVLSLKDLPLKSFSENAAARIRERYPYGQRQNALLELFD